MASDISEALRAEVAARAGYRCEYCLIREEDAGFRLQIDHVISRKHGGASAASNLAYSCVVCNRLKGTDIASIDPISAKIVPLFNPRTESWDVHFRVAGPIIEPLSAVGRATERLLRLNAAERLAERRLIYRLGGSLR